MKQRNKIYNSFFYAINSKPNKKEVLSSLNLTNQGKNMNAHNKAEKFWDRMANYFDREERKNEPTNIKIIEKTRNRLKTSDIVLDYGCGTGTAAIEIASCVKEVKGIDISSKMIEAAKRKTVVHKVKNIDFAQTTIFDEKLKKGSFDVIFSFHLLHLVEDTPKVMQRINELLKPSGLFISATPCKGESFVQRIFYFLFGKIIRIPYLKFFKIQELKSLMTDGNFEIVETECLHQIGQQYFIVAKKI
ncbi:MAG: methyltransferase domain-containing protein [Ignavibacteriaceae bacterium]|jgi:2-polyprenyl-3-methyl-5-hydroxy-6-metoxy-1,4-benzoquinol methylase|nr:methyltransferase domain-containing protein [Ignavibacteriaceae bacterium]